MHPPELAPQPRLVGQVRVQVRLRHPLADPATERKAVLTGTAEMNPRVDSGVSTFLSRLGKARERSRDAFEWLTACEGEARLVPAQDAGQEYDHAAGVTLHAYRLAHGAQFTVPVGEVTFTVVREGNDTVRMMLAQLLPGSPTHDAKVALMRLMEDDDLVVREAATRSAGEMGAEILPSLAPLVHDPHAAVQRAVKDALRTIGSEAVPFLLDLASGSEGQARELAVSVLSDIGTPAAVFGLVERGIAVQPR